MKLFIYLIILESLALICGFLVWLAVLVLFAL